MAPETTDDIRTNLIQARTRLRSALSQLETEEHSRQRPRTVLVGDLRGCIERVEDILRRLADEGDSDSREGREPSGEMEAADEVAEAGPSEELGPTAMPGGNGDWGEDD